MFTGSMLVRFRVTFDPDAAQGTNASSISIAFYDSQVVRVNL